MAKSLDTFVQLEKVQKFAEFAKGVFSKPEWKSLGFEAFISKPFQRLCQYPSQLQVLILKKLSFVSTNGFCFCFFPKAYS